MASIWQDFQSIFFSEKFWLTDNTTWDDFKNVPGSDFYIAQPIDLMWIFPTGAVIFVVRILFERLIAYPLGHYMNISTKTVIASNNPPLQTFYKKTHNPSDKQVTALSKQLDISERAIQRWFRRRRNQDRPSVMVKFTETAWRCFFYISAFVYGFCILWDKEWLWDVKACWRGHPRQHVSNDVWWYYNIELGFYVCLLFSQFADVKRKDFWEMFLHHITTILLMSFSWIINYVRIGTLIVCLHDSVDYLLEGAKLARYMNKRMICDVLFGIFTLMWAVTRLTIYPLVILRTVYYDTAELSGYSHSLIVFNLLLWILQVLHVIWFKLIAGVAWLAVVEGKVEKDVRSASEESDEPNAAQ